MSLLLKEIKSLGFRAYCLGIIRVCWLFFRNVWGHRGNYADIEEAMDREMKRVRGSTLDQAPLNRSGIMEKYWKLTLAQTALSSVVPIRGCGFHLRYMGATKDVNI